MRIQNIFESAEIFTDVERLDSANREAGWNIEYRQLRPRSFVGRFIAENNEDFTTSSEKIEGAAQVIAEQSDNDATLFLTDTTEGRLLFNGQELSSLQLGVVQAGCEIEIVTAGITVVDSLRIPEKDYLRSLRVLLPGYSSKRSTSFIHGDQEGLNSIREKIRRTYFVSQLRLGTKSDILAEMVLWMSEHSGYQERDARSKTNQVAVDARRAKNYIDDHIYDKITMQDLCEVTGLGLRTLQRRFAEYYQMCPVNYIRAQRLNRARRSLFKGHRATDSVTQIAMNCGYNHLGRFSADYRNHFGELPKHTLESKCM